MAALSARCYAPSDTTSAPADDASAPVVVRCTTARSSEKIPQRKAIVAAAATMTTSDLIAQVQVLCGECHKGPNDTPFQLTAEKDPPITLADLKTAALNSRMIRQTVTGAMPPAAGSIKQKAAVQLGEAMQAWEDQGFPDGTFSLNQVANGTSGITQILPAVAEAMTDLGSCIPDPDQGHFSDPEKDAFFEGLTQLPPYLSDTDTDVYTMDVQQMAAHGTYAYVPTYQLWSDDAKKIRLVHVPNGKSIEYDPPTRKFKIPPNTRFYKTFFKQVVRGHTIGYRKMETRLIVTRENWQDAVFGTYIWNEDETVATLHADLYRDGTPFTDRVLIYEKDESLHDVDAGGDADPTGAPPLLPPTRNYGVPGRFRCTQCHMGAEAQNFVLGFTPLDVNRRPITEGGLSYLVAPLEEDELSQVDRLIKYGVISGIRSADDLPKLEDMGNDRLPRNDQELAVQAYMVGNCAHCHNPNGFATQSNSALSELDFSAGSLFQFQTELKSTDGTPYLNVNNYGGAANSSVLWQRLVNDTSISMIHMPTNVPGKDCRAANLVAEWAATFLPESAPADPVERSALVAQRIADSLVSSANQCVAQNDVYWVAEDPTDKIPFQPRNNSWNDPQKGIATSFISQLNLTVTPELENLAKESFHTNFWEPKPECKFPSLPDTAYPELSSAPNPELWMLNVLGEPQQNWGEIYDVIPGANVFHGICSSCHGTTGDGQSGAAKVLTAISGYRVADLVDFLFGPHDHPGQNLHVFDSLGPDGLGAARYLVWMGSGGTKVKFPTGFLSTWVKPNSADIDYDYQGGDGVERYGPNMLAAAESACDLIRTSQFGTGGGGGISGTTLWTAICTTNNPLTEEIRTTPSNDACSDGSACVANWLQHGEFNAGVMAYFYLRDYLSQGKTWPRRTECEQRYLSTEGQ